MQNICFVLVKRWCIWCMLNKIGRQNNPATRIGGQIKSQRFGLIIWPILSTSMKSMGKSKLNKWICPICFCPFCLLSVNVLYICCMYNLCLHKSGVIAELHRRSKFNGFAWYLWIIFPKSMWHVTLGVIGWSWEKPNNCK